MGEYSVYYVPFEQEAFIGRETEIANKFWDIGIFLDTSDSAIMKRLKSMRWVKFRIPKTSHKFSYGGMGLHDGKEEIVPNYVENVKCPSCKTNISDTFSEVTENWDFNDGTVLSATIECPSCSKTFNVNQAEADEPSFTSANFYLYVSDVFPKDDWEPEFRKTVESVLGPCKEFVAWEF